jgi:eukaryotic-like serine/threonine-protein kinase
MGAGQTTSWSVRTEFLPQAVRELHRFEVLGRLGAGGMAEVFLVRERVEPRRTAVLKRLLPTHAQDDEIREMFFDEARLAMRLSHPSLCRIYDAGFVAGQPCIAMEWVQGATLHELIERTCGRGLSVDTAISIAQTVAGALDSVHRARDERGNRLAIVHRDVTPKNVMIGFDGRVKLLDFGVAKSLANQSITRPGTARGNLAYLAPELWLGQEADGRADVFSLGVTLFESLSCRPLYGFVRPRDAMNAIVNGPVPSLRDVRGDVPPMLDAIVQSALAKHPADRLESAGTMQSALQELLQMRYFSDQQGTLRALMNRLFADEIACGPTFIRGEC